MASLIEGHGLESTRIRQSIIVVLIDRYLRVGLDPYISLNEVNRMLYLLQEVGVPFGLHYEKTPDGPLAGNFIQMIRRDKAQREMNGLTEESPIEFLPRSVVDDAQEILAGYPKLNDSINRVMELIYGFETSFGLELLGTVHWTVSGNITEPMTLDHLIDQIYIWDNHVAKFSPRLLEITLKHLSDKCFLISTILA